MGAALYLSLILLIFCLARAARTSRKQDPAAIAPEELPESAWRALQRSAQGITVAEAWVSMNGETGLRYRVRGVMPDGRQVELDIHHDGTAYRRDGPPPLPRAAGRA